MSRDNRSVATHRCDLKQGSGNIHKSTQMSRVLGELHRDLSYLMMGKGVSVAGADRGEAPGPKPEPLGRRLRLRHQPPRSWQLLILQRWIGVPDFPSDWAGTGLTSLNRKRKAFSGLTSLNRKRKAFSNAYRSMPYTCASGLLQATSPTSFVFSTAIDSALEYEMVEISEESRSPSLQSRRSEIHSPRAKVLGTGVKRSRIVKDVLRNANDGLSDSAMDGAGGLHNLRVQNRNPPDSDRPAAREHRRGGTDLPLSSQTHE